MVAAEDATPLWITPLVKCRREEPDVGRYEILQALVTESPNSNNNTRDGTTSEIETALEVFFGPDDVPLWKRVVVRSGPICPQSVIHASFQLPNLEGGQVVDASAPTGNALCWTAFPDHPDHALLCVLASPTLLCIWDVYPDRNQASSVGEGHSIPLPFEAHSIHALEGGQSGLLIQRIETIDDHLDAQNQIWTTNNDNAADVDDDDGGFVLKAPPKPVRTSIDTLNISSTSVQAIPSLFSLSHPLDDVLPIYDMTHCHGTGSLPGVITDVFEKVLFVGTLSGVDPNDDYLNRKEFRYPICVTYHVQKKRHAIWELQKAPAPPPQAPLWRVSSQWRSDNGMGNHLGIIEQDLEDMELLGATTDEGFDTSHYDEATRHDALADALGIRKTPRKAADDAAPRGRAVGARSATRGQSRPSSKVANAANNNSSGNNMSLISPMARTINNIHDSAHTMMDADASVDSTGRPPLLTMGPFASLFPKVSMTCLHEDNKMSLEASRVFIASNLEGSGRMTVCLVCPGQEESGNPNTLRLFSFEDRDDSNDMTDNSVEGLARKYAIASEVSVSCLTAVPVESSPVAPPFYPHAKHRTRTWRESAVDILVLRDDQGAHKLSLYRGSLPITDCAVQKGTEIYDTSHGAQFVDLVNSVGDRFDLVLKNDFSPEISVRAQVSLRMKYGATGEKILGALESAVHSMADLSGPERAEVATKLRSDCVRLEQSLAANTMENVGADAIEAVVLAIVQLELFGTNVNSDENNGVSSLKKSAKEGSAWERLLQTKFHQKYVMDNPDFLFKSPPPLPKKSSKPSNEGLISLACLFSTSVETLKTSQIQVAESFFSALHYLYEEVKLDVTNRYAAMPAVGTILAKLCALGPDVESNVYVKHYKRDLGETWYQSLNLASASIPRQNFVIGAPFCIFSWIDAIMSRGKDEGQLEPSSILSSCTLLRSVVRVYKALYVSTLSSTDAANADAQRSRDFDVVKILLEEGFKTRADLCALLSPGVVLPLLEVFHRCRASHQRHGSWVEDPEIWSLIGREDLRNNAELSEAYITQSKSAASGTGHPAFLRDDDQGANLEDKDMDGLSPLEYTSAMLFPDDNRIREVGRLLRSSRPVFLSVPRAIEVSDHDYERLKQEKLLLLSRRVLALPIGRGMITIGNLQPVPAEPLPLPELCLVGRVPPTNAMLALDTADCPTDLKVWPDFNNGVAAGLRLPLEHEAGELVSKITRTWIVYNRPGNQAQPTQNAQGTNSNAQPNLGHAHGGLLMALGLRGHLTTLEMTDIFDYLTQGSVTTTVGVLLGMAANMRGTCDISVSKMLCLHIPSLIPQHFSAIDVASAVQAAAVSGAGLLYQGSSHRMMTEFLLNEIGKRPSNDGNVVDREAYTLSCGIALGMVNLRQGEGEGNGNGNAGLADLRIEERLYRYVVGGLDDAEMRRKRDEGDRLSLPTTSASTGNEKCSCVYEGDSINTDVTAPAATLALGLIYMMSGNKTIASAISLPSTHFLLEYVRPDFLMLRVIARSLILWDDVVPSSSWIESQLPVAVQDAYGQMKEHAKRLSQPGGSSASGAYKDFDRQAVRLIYAHVIAGACFSIGLRFAGTGNRDAAGAIFERVMEFRNLRDGADPVSCALRPASPVLEMCLGCAALSLSMVLAGTGDLETLRLLKVLRWRCDEEVNYGSHMAFGAAIGLLFLGGGTSTIGREPEDIAALLLAFYPRFPSSTSDNQYHLQALRNLYALAVKRRDIRAIDVDTRETVFVPIQVRYENDRVPPANLTAPCLLSNANAKANEIRVVSERYYPVVLNLRDRTGGQIFFVKRRSAHLSYKQDPDSKRSLLVQTGTLHGENHLDLVSSFTNDKAILAFAKHFCGIGLSGSGANSGDPFTVEGFCRRVLFESLMLDTQEALPLYLFLRNAINVADPKARTSIFAAWDFRLIKSYYVFRRLLVSEATPRILNVELVVYLNELLERTMNSKASGGAPLSILDGPRAILYGFPLHEGAEIETEGELSDAMDLS